MTPSILTKKRILAVVCIGQNDFRLEPCHGFSSYSMIPTASLQMSSSSSYTFYATPSTIEATIKNHTIERQHAQEIVKQFLCPPTEELQRNEAGMQAFDEGGLGIGAIMCDDPRTEYTFDQFPLRSFDLLIDRALDHVEQSQHKTIVD